MDFNRGRGIHSNGCKYPGKIYKPFLVANKAEVKRMCITEYDEARTFAEQREDGALDILVSLIKKGLLTLAQAAEKAHMTVAEFEEKTGLKA